MCDCAVLILLLVATMAAQSAKASADFLKNAVITNPTAKHTATVIFLHGLGDTGQGWCSILSETKQPYVKLICPTAPVMPVTVNGGFKMPSWFDIYGLDKSVKQDEKGIRAAALKVHELLDNEQKTTGISSDRIILGGFSQGGSLAMYSALTYNKPLAGILALSSWLPLHNVLQEKMEAVNKEVPFLQCHGDYDMTVQLKWGEMTSQFVSTFNKTNYEFKTYHGLAHSSCTQEMEDVQRWLDKHLPIVCMHFTEFTHCMCMQLTSAERYAPWCFYLLRKWRTSRDGWTNIYHPLVETFEK